MAAPITAPIWRDVYIDIDVTELGTTSDYIYYSVKVGEDVIYRGKAYYFNNRCRFKLNDICRDYLKSDMNFSKQWYFNKDYKKRFTVYTSIDNFETENEYQQVDFSYDWSYEGMVDEKHLSDPIQDYLDYRQLFLFSALGDYYVTFINYKDLPDRDYIPEQNVHDFDELSFMYHLNRNNIGEDVTINGYSRKFRVQDSCKDYCLYFINPRGGWDWFLINGTTTKQYNYSRKFYEKNFNNDTLEFGKVNYLTDITEKWTLTTGLLSNNQSKKMFNLFSSNEVYLHDLNNDFITPVNVTNTTQDEKNNKNQTKKLISYSITVESAQNKIRK